jgi:hypothetical protein
MAKTRAEVVKKVRALEKQRDQGTAPKVGQRYRVHAWLTYGVENIACPPNVSENAHSGYEVDVRVHLIPGIGEHWLDKLTPKHLEKLYAKMMKGGTLSPDAEDGSPKSPVQQEPFTMCTARSGTRSTRLRNVATFPRIRRYWLSLDPPTKYPSMPAV